MVALATAGTLQSAHDVSDGGLAVTLAESCFASSSNLSPTSHPERSPRSEGSAFSSLGASVSLPEDSAAEYALFGERGARILVSVSPGQLAALRSTARQYGVGAHEIGKVTRDNSLRIEYKGQAVVQSDVPSLHDIWVNSLQRSLKV
jgi:phosphoribosylformylglycinamidine synthase